MPAAGGDLDAEDGGHEQHGDERQRESPHRAAPVAQRQRGPERQQRQSGRDEEGGAERAGRGTRELILEAAFQGRGRGRLRRRQAQGS